MTAKQIKELCSYLEKQVKNHCIYVWGGQGEYLRKVKFGKLEAMETSDENVARVLEFIAKCKRNKYDMSQARFFDCSGLLVNWLLKHGLISSDTTAAGLYSLCSTKVDISQIKKGDFVFKKDVKGNIVHVGCCVDDKKSIIESYGRDYGVVKNTLGSSGCSKFTLAARM